MAEPAPTLPMFFRAIAPLDASRHGELRLSRGRDYGFARASNVAPLALQEALAAAADYPIVFGGPGQSAMLAIVGFRERENLYIDKNGAWRPGTYVPAYLRNYPFAFIEASTGKALMLGIDPQAECLGSEGQPLFAGTEPTDALKEALELCKQLFQSLKETAAFCAALESQGLLVENSARIEFNAGGSAVLGGFRVIDQQKFAALPDATFLDWRRRQWLQPIYAHFLSAGRWGRIVDIAVEPRA